MRMNRNLAGRRRVPLISRGEDTGSPCQPDGRPDLDTPARWRNRAHASHGDPYAGGRFDSASRHCANARDWRTRMAQELITRDHWQSGRVGVLRPTPDGYCCDLTDTVYTAQEGVVGCLTCGLMRGIDPDAWLKTVDVDTPSETMTLDTWAPDQHVWLYASGLTCRCRCGTDLFRTGFTTGCVACATCATSRRIPDGAWCEIVPGLDPDRFYI